MCLVIKSDTTLYTQAVVLQANQFPIKIIMFKIIFRKNLV